MSWNPLACPLLAPVLFSTELKSSCGTPAGCPGCHPQPCFPVWPCGVEFPQLSLEALLSQQGLVGRGSCCIIDGAPLTSRADGLVTRGSFPLAVCGVPLGPLFRTEQSHTEPEPQGQLAGSVPCVGARLGLLALGPVEDEEG